MENTLYTRIVYWDNNCNKVEIVKNQKRMIAKKINSETIFDLREKPVVVITRKENINIDRSNVKEINEKTIKNFMNIFNNQKYRKYFKFFLICTITLTSVATPVCASTEAVTAVNPQNLAQVYNFIHFIINIMKGIIVSICGLQSANAGIKILTEERATGVGEAKQTAQKILWALFLVFAGAPLAEWIAQKVISGGM